jgi:hypothetical protein
MKSNDCTKGSPWRLWCPAVGWSSSRPHPDPSVRCTQCPWDPDTAWTTWSQAKKRRSQSKRRGGESEHWFNLADEAEVFTLTSPMRNATGMPCIFPEFEVAGVLMSAWASTWKEVSIEKFLGRFWRSSHPHDSCVLPVFFNSGDSTNCNRMVTTWIKCKG